MPEKQEVKKTEKVTLADKASYKAVKGKRLPLFYKKEILKVGDSKDVEIEKKHLSYESRRELVRAIEKKLVLITKK